MANKFAVSLFRPALKRRGYQAPALFSCSRERPSPPTGESGEKQQKMEIKTDTAEQESVEEVEAATSELVDGSVKSKELASQTIQETATLSAEKCVEVVVAIPEFVESFLEPKELVSQTITEVGNPSGKLPLLSRLVAVRRGEPPVFLPSSILDNNKSGLTTLLIAVLKVFPILKKRSQWAFMGRNWDRTLGDTGGEMWKVRSLLDSHLAGNSGSSLRLLAKPSAGFCSTFGLKVNCLIVLLPSPLLGSWSIPCFQEEKKG